MFRFFRTRHETDANNISSKHVIGVKSACYVFSIKNI